MLPQRSEKSLRRMLVSISFIASEMVAWGSTNSYFLRLRGGRKKGRGSGEGEKRKKRGKGKGAYPLSLIPLSFSLPPYPYPFRRLLRRLLFSRRVKQEPKKVSAPRRQLDVEYRKRFAATG